MSDKPEPASPDDADWHYVGGPFDGRTVEPSVLASGAPLSIGVPGRPSHERYIRNYASRQYEWTDRGKR